MKKIKFFALSLVTMLACGTFLSCDDEDSENEMPKPSVSKRLVNVFEDGGWGSDDIIIAYDDNGRISTVTNKTINEIVQYTYSNDEIIVEYDGRTVCYKLSGGLVNSFTDADGGRYSFTYEGRKLTKYENSYNKCFTYKWSDGNVVSSEFDAEGETGKYQYEYDTEHYDYGGVAAFFQSSWILFDTLDEYLLIQGYFGDMPKNIIKTISEGDTEDRLYYDFDADGYPISWTRWDIQTTFTWEIVE